MGNMLKFYLFLPPPPLPKYCNAEARHLKVYIYIYEVSYVSGLLP